MPRTTVNIDAPILQELKRLQREEGKSLGKLVSDLLAVAITRHEEERLLEVPLSWEVTEGSLRIDPLDKDAVYAMLDTDRGDG